MNQKPIPNLEFCFITFVVFVFVVQKVMMSAEAGMVGMLIVSVLWLADDMNIMIKKIGKNCQTDYCVPKLCG